MANWASTNYVIEGPKNKVQLIFNTIDDLISGRTSYNRNFGDSWEESIINELNNTENPIDFSSF